MIIAAIIAAVAAIAAAFLSFIGNRAQSTMESRLRASQNDLEIRLQGEQADLQRELADRQDKIRQQVEVRDYKIRQLNELYGPLFMLRAESRRLREQIGPPSEEWRLVDHIAEVKVDQTRAPIVERILAINSRISELVIGKAGLFVSYPSPNSFQEFLSHARLLALSWEAGADQSPEHRLPFPLDFDQDVESAMALIGHDLEDTQAHA